MTTLYPPTQRSACLVAAYTDDYRAIRITDMRIEGWQERAAREVEVYGSGIEQAIRRVERWLREHPELVALDEDWRAEAREKDRRGLPRCVRAGPPEMRREEGQRAFPI